MKPEPGAGAPPSPAAPARPSAPLSAGPLSPPPAGSCPRPLPGPRVPSPAGGARTEDGAEESSGTSRLPPFVQGEGVLSWGPTAVAGAADEPVQGLGGVLALDFGAGGSGGQQAAALSLAT